MACRTGLPVMVVAVITLLTLACGDIWAKVSKVRPFDLENITLLDGPYKENLELDREYLHSIDSDRLLHTWRVNAGLPTDAEPLGGWERPDCELRGHSMGHYLSACALMYANTGDEKLKAKADALVAELAKCQQALDSNGYLSAFPESFIDRVENCKPVWAPYYTLHKVFAGLIDMHRYCGNEQALEIAEGMAQWLQGRLQDVDREQMQRILNHTEQGGMNDALANLYAATRDEDYLKLAQRFQEDHYVDPLAAGEDNLTGEHANSFIPTVVGAARLYELAGKKRNRRVAENFWNLVAEGRTYCTGGTSESEHFHEPTALPLSNFNQEFCCTYNMLKLTRHLFCWDPQPEYADYYSHALWNHVVGAQDPERGMMGYFLPLASGRWKTFNKPFDSFWCCTGTGMESHAKYGKNIYFHDQENLYVNLLIASEINWKAKGVTVRQETDFPESESTTLTVWTDSPTTFALKVHVPRWATGGTSVLLNGEKLQKNPQPSSYLTIRRSWRDGDTLKVTMSMGLHKAPHPSQPNRVALMYGPVVLAGELSGEGLNEDMIYTSQNWYRYPEASTAEAPTLVYESGSLEDWIKPVQNRPLTFRTTGQKHNVTLTPLYDLFYKRYVVYWPFYRKGSNAYREMLERRRARERLRQRMVDEVKVGDRQSEEAHNLQGENTSNGTHRGRAWRHATDGGWFSYDLKALPDIQMTLRCTYWGGDSGARTFDVLVDGRKLATETLDRNKPGEFFHKDYTIPAEMTDGKRKVRVRFEAHAGNYAGGIFGCAMLKPEE